MHCHSLVNRLEDPSIFVIQVRARVAPADALAAEV
jgi:hypothetical protein